MAAIYRHHVLHGVASFEEDPPSADGLRPADAGVLETAGVPG